MHCVMCEKWIQVRHAFYVIVKVYICMNGWCSATGLTLIVRAKIEMKNKICVCFSDMSDKVELILMPYAYFSTLNGNEYN